MVFTYVHVGAHVVRRIRTHKIDERIFETWPMAYGSVCRLGCVRLLSYVFMWCDVYKHLIARYFDMSGLDKFAICYTVAAILVPIILTNAIFFIVAQQESCRNQCKPRRRRSRPQQQTFNSRPVVTSDARAAFQS